MPRIVELIPRDGFRLFVRFEDGTSGEVDLSSLRGQGVFAAWDTPGVFETVTISSESGAPTWLGKIDICPDSLYRDVNGKNS